MKTKLTPLRKILSNSVRYPVRHFIICSVEADPIYNSVWHSVDNSVLNSICNSGWNSIIRSFKEYPYEN